MWSVYHRCIVLLGLLPQAAGCARDQGVEKVQRRIAIPGPRNPQRLLPTPLAPPRLPLRGAERSAVLDYATVCVPRVPDTYCVVDACLLS